MGRTKQFDEATALASAMQLFWAKGYAATSLQDLEEATGLKRTSIYNTFGNKRSIFQKTLTLYRQQVEEKLASIMNEAPNCRAAISQWLTAVIDMHFSKETPGGCLMILSVLESSQYDEQTKEMASSLFHKEKDMVAKRLKHGVKEGELSKDFDCNGVAGAVAAASSGLMVLAMAGYPRKALEQVAQATLRLLED